MRIFKDKRVVVTGGRRGLGLGIVEALLARAAQVTVVARDPSGLADVERLGAAARPGDVTDPGLMSAIVADVRPRGSTPWPLDRGVPGRTVWRPALGPAVR